MISDHVHDGCRSVEAMLRDDLEAAQRELAQFRLSARLSRERRQGKHGPMAMLEELLGLGRTS